LIIFAETNEFLISGSDLVKNIECKAP